MKPTPFCEWEAGWNLFAVFVAGTTKPAHHLDLALVVRCEACCVRVARVIIETSLRALEEWAPIPFFARGARSFVFVDRAKSQQECWNTLSTVAEERKKGNAIEALFLKQLS